jgi:molybdopterin converting factor small subunit
MAYTVRIPTPLQKFTQGAESVSCEAGSLSGLLAELSTRYPELKDRICEADGRPRRFFNVYVNEEDIRFLGGNSYEFKEGDDVLILPSIAGGC